MIIIFDTDCVLCSGWIRLVLRYEKDTSTRFVSAWSQEGLGLAHEHGYSIEDLDRTFLIVKDDKALTKSEASIAMLSQLKAPWSWGRFIWILPKPFRDWGYSLIARNRYRWFGRRKRCFVPPTDQAHRFVSGPPRSEALPNHR